jgi:hypothetical protein
LDRGNSDADIFLFHPLTLLADYIFWKVIHSFIHSRKYKKFQLYPVGFFWVLIKSALWKKCDFLPNRGNSGLISLTCWKFSNTLNMSGKRYDPMYWLVEKIFHFDDSNFLNMFSNMINVVTAYYLTWWYLVTVTMETRPMTYIENVISKEYTS